MARVLLVDDDALIRTSESEILRREGHTVHTAADAATAREIWNRGPLDVAILDLVLPGQGGIEALADLTRSHPDVVVMIQTGYADLDSALRALRAGATDYLRKPVPPEHLCEAVDRAANRAQELRSIRRRLASSERLTSLGVLAAGIAHEVNNPMASVVSNLQTLERYAREIREDWRAGGSLASGRGGATEDIEQVLEDVPLLIKDTLEGTSRVTAIVNGLRAYAKGDTSRQTRFDLKTILEETLKLAQGRLAQVSTVVTDLPAGRTVQGNPVQIQEVFLNIVLNAAHAVESTGRRGTIRVDLLKEGEQGEWTGFEVADTGCGIRPEHLPHIFDPFFTTKPPGEGTGLGLSIAYSIVQGHGGEIRVETTPGRGTRFVVRLPGAPCEGRGGPESRAARLAA